MHSVLLTGGAGFIGANTVPVVLPVARGSLPGAISIAGEAGRICSLEGS
jgi:dTDP-D-glucose 4,6-dehydratase